MRLEKIKLAGFKSFVDQTVIPFPSNLVGIVGPNGCGKSNVIDAVRWVMGETSAKQLRGESIADVIFNGSTNRKPIGQASIELTFDNSAGKIGGQYSGYNQISIRRCVGRDAQSTYFLNGSRCRRRDIVDIFLGTGLGARSYSIIEQGMIAELIEAKPDELRMHLEEAAGISKYKERRRETENRIKHTRENLDRINDLREELRLQLNRLQRQARAAKRYKVLKEEERVLKAQLLALRWLALDNEAKNFNVVVSQHETLLSAHLAKLQHIDTEIEKQRALVTDQSDEYHQVQEKYYHLGSEIARLEQSIQHQKELRQQLILDLQQTETAWREAQQSLAADEQQLAELNHSLVELEENDQQIKTKVDHSQKLLNSAEQAMHGWQVEWDEFNADAAKATQDAQVEQTRIQHLEEQQHKVTKQLDRIAEEKQAIDTTSLESELTSLQEAVTATANEVNQAQEQLATVADKLGQQRNKNTSFEQELHKLQEKLHDLRGQRTSLEALQQAAMGDKHETLIQWLEHNQLHDKPRLARNLQVADGWELAVETVLGSYLQAICVQSVDAVAEVLGSLEHGKITLFDVVSTSVDTSVVRSDKETLASKVTSSLLPEELLSGVYIAGSLNTALAERKSLLPHESFVTRDGIWLGRNWLRVTRESKGKSGIISREKQLRQLAQDVSNAEAAVATAEAQLVSGREYLTKLEQQREQLQQQFAEIQAKLLDDKAQQQIKQSQFQQIKQRWQQLTSEFTEHNKFIEHTDQELVIARRNWQTALQLMEQHAEMRETLLHKRDEFRRELDLCREAARQDQEAAHEIALQLQAVQTKIASLQQARERMQRQIATLAERRTVINGSLTQDDTPVEEMQQQLEVLLQQRLTMEKELTDAKQHLSQLEHDIHELERQRHTEEEQAQNVRNQLEEKRLRSKEFKVRQATLQEQLTETASDLETLIKEMPETATIEAWQQEIEQVAVRISRLGPINLAAIEEHEQAAERKQYLDSQHADLEEALTTLQNAIRKIDRQTRMRFKETFDKVNENFQQIFPKVFGGGKACLELTGEDLLETGVSLIAKPPGKHVNSIHLLSGGEKALTAIALMFALFQLNPAPFCMLDEVDAPLDDANVGRFCDLVKEMSQKVQFIFISHNTGTIEMARHLMGVTMNEPGVSRIVSVDIDAAVAMAE